MLTKREEEQLENMCKRLEDDPATPDDIYMLVDKIYELDKRAEAKLDEIRKVAAQMIALEKASSAFL